MKKTSLIITLIAGLAMTSKATSILSEDFTYPNGAIVGAAGSPWVLTSGTAGTMITTNSELEVSGSRSEDIAALLSGGPYMTNGPTTAVYAKFSVYFLSPPTGAGTSFAHFTGDNITTDFRARLISSVTNVTTLANATAGNFFIGIANNSSAVASSVPFPTELTTNVVYTVVVRYVLATGISTLWIDPIDENSTSVTTSISPSLANPKYYAFRQAGNEGVIRIDALRVGTQFSDVAGANTAPSISSISGQSISMDGVAGPIPFTVNDAEQLASTLTISKASTNTTLVPLTGIVIVDGDGTNRTVTVTPNTGIQGKTLVTLTVSDGVNTADTSFLVTVGAPSISAIANQITISNVTTAAIPFTIGDAETSAGSLNLTVSAPNGPLASIALGGSLANRTITLTPTPDQIGVATITVTVDDTINTNSTTFRLSVTPSLGVVLADEFNYSTFLLPNALLQADGSTWLHGSGATSYELQVTNGLAYLNSTLTEDLAAQLTNVLSATNGPFLSSSGVVLYAGCTINCSSLPTQSGSSSYFAHFKDTLTGGNFRAKIFAETNNAAAGKFRIGIANNGNGSTQFPQDLDVGTTYTVVTRYSVGVGEASLWVNPANEGSASVTGTDALQTASIGYYALRQDAGFGQVELGKLKIATSFAEVLPVTTPSPIALEIQQSGGNVILTWTNAAYSLQASPSVSGTYTNIPSATTGYSTPVSGEQRYFRLVYP